MPIFGDDSDINKNDLGLWPIRIAKWRGLIFAQIIPEDAKLLTGEDVDNEFINSNLGFIERMKDIPLENWNFYSNATHKLECNWKVYVENYLEGYHIPNMHPGLNKMVDMKDYTVLNGDNYCEHIVSTIPTSGTTMGGVWLWLSPTLAINTYEGGMSLERIVPTGPSTCEIRYQYLFDKNTAAKDVDISIDTSVEVTTEDIEICEAVQKSFSSGGYYRPGI
jgi:choline monooxygenase